MPRGRRGGSGAWWAGAVSGDGSGCHRHRSAARTHWQLCKALLGQQGNLSPSALLGRVNPLVKDGINCGNARRRNQAGERRLAVDPRCKQLIRDFEQVSWKKDLSGNCFAELDKSDRLRTHVSDALGSMVAKVFPMPGQGGERSVRVC